MRSSISAKAIRAPAGGRCDERQGDVEERRERRRAEVACGLLHPGIRETARARTMIAT
jgi:hypothetical protein